MYTVFAGLHNGVDVYVLLDVMMRLTAVLMARVSDQKTPKAS